MNASLFQSELIESSGPLHPAGKGSLLLRMIRASQPITRSELAKRLGIDKSTVTEYVKPLLSAGILTEGEANTGGQGRRPRALSFADRGEYFIGLNLGVRRSQLGTSGLNGEITEEAEFDTPADSAAALKMAREHIDEIRERYANKTLLGIGISVPGMTNAERTQLVFAPNLQWSNIDIKKAVAAGDDVRVVVDNDSTAAAMYEARAKIRGLESGLLSNFILVRSGTGIGVGLVIGSEVYRGTGLGRGIAGEFGHMTIVAGGKPCVCGNRGCWERYASAASAASLYLGDRPPARGEQVPRFIEIVSKATNGENRARRTLEKIGEYLGIGIANVIMGTGIPRVIISGRLVYSWEFIKGPINDAINRSIVGRFEGWSVEAGEPAGGAVGGALEAAIESYLVKD